MLTRISRLSLLWKILLSTSIALTLLFAITGWIVLDSATRAMSESVDQEVRSSFRAYDSLWRARADALASVSLVMSRMSDVRAAFSTGDQATIRDTAAELWNKVSDRQAVFLVTDPRGQILASLGGPDKERSGASLGDDFKQNLPIVPQSAPGFPKQASGFMVARGRLYHAVVTPVYVQSGNGLALLNVLVAGYTIDSDVANQLKTSTGGSEFCFLWNDHVGASTLASSLNPQIENARATTARAMNNAGPTRFAAAGVQYAALTTPLLDVEGHPIAELRILHSLENERLRNMELRRNIVLVWLFAMFLGLGLTYLLARRILKPVQELDRAAAEVSRGNYDYRVPLDAHSIGQYDELGRLAQAFNAMCESIQGGRRELIRQERIATIGRLSTSIVHDLRNPLAAIYGGAEMLIDGALSVPQVHRLAGNIYKSSRRMQQLLQELVDTGRGKSSGTEVCRLREVIDAAYEVYTGAAEAQSVSVQIDVPEALELRLERARIERVFMNLIDNALAAMPHGGQLRIGAQTEDHAVLVRVADTGPGIAPQIRSQLFQPFVTAGKKNGVGLGLAFSHQTVLDHGGTLWIDPALTPGACFFIKLPF